jgi:Cu-Zn family superoxide dismutase
VVINEYILPGEQVFPEGITEDPDGVTFYVSSARDGTVFRGRTDRDQVDVWLPGGADGRTEALGMAVDHAGRLLVCGGSTGHLFAVDRASGALAARYPVPSSATLLNDVCVLDGCAYVTDSVRPVVWRLPLDGEPGDPGDPSRTGGPGQPAVWVDLTGFGARPDVEHYLNGIASTGTGGPLVVAAQGAGVLWRVDVTSAEAVPIDLGGVTVNGDGMVVVGDLLYVCDNSDEPDGSVRFWLTALRLTADARRGELVGRWERPYADTPTTAAYLGGRLYLVNSQFAAARDGTAKAPFTVSALAPPA